MKFIIALSLFVTSLAVGAQQPSPKQTPQQAEIQKQAELLQAQSQLLYEKLHGITEFQQYLTVQRQLLTLQTQYDAIDAHSTPQHSETSQIKPKK